MMTPAQRQLVFDLVITAPSGRSKISKEEFVRRFPDAIGSGGLSVELLEQAVREKNAADVACALTIGFTFGFSKDHEATLCRLAYEDWHSSHENVVSALEYGGYEDEACIEALYQLAKIVPPYLEFDEARALAVKAIWALSRIPGRLAQAKLEELAKSSSPKIRPLAEEKLNRRSSS